jgi:hypothetical protein
MRLSERFCCICDAPADPSATSAHVLVVRYFCTAHSAAFHSSEAFRKARAASSSADALAHLESWCSLARAAAGHLRTRE